MPIKVSCQCGKTLQAPDAAAGKAVKCPGCGKAVRVPSGSGGGARSGAGKTKAKPKPKPAAARPTAAPSSIGSDDLGDLFDEAGISTKVESVCPSCRVEMKSSAVFCTNCGFNLETGEQVESHKLAGVDIDHGTLALEKAADDMVKDIEMQKDLIAGGGMPWWMLVMVLVIGGGTLGLAVLAVNASNQETEVEGAPTLFVSVMMLIAATLSFGSFVCVLRITFHAFKQSIVEGLMTLLIPFYILYHVFKNRQEVGKVFGAALLMTFASAGAMYMTGEGGGGGSSGEPQTALDLYIQEQNR